MSKWNRREFMQASTASWLLKKTKVSDWPGSPAVLDDAFVHTNEEGKSWTVGNSLVEREIRFDPERGLHTARWVHKVTGTDFMEECRKRDRPGREFSFSIDDDSLAGSNGAAWDLLEVKTQKVRPSGESLIIRLRAKSKPADVSVFYAVYDGHPVIQKWIAIANRGTDPLTLSHLSFESSSITPGPPDSLQASAFYGSQPRELFFTGRVDDTAVLERNSLTGEGFVAMNGAPGFTKRTELTGWGDGVQLMYDTDLFPFERRVQPGEDFITAKGSVAFFVEGKGFADPRWTVPSYTAQVLMKKGAAYQPPWIYNTWEPFQRRINRDIALVLT